MDEKYPKDTILLTHQADPEMNGAYIRAAKVRDLIETAHITDTDNFGEGSLHEVWLDADLWNELARKTGAEKNRR